MINLTFVKYLLHAYKLLSIISFSPHKKFMKMDTFIISILYLRTLGKENYLIYTKSQNSKWWKQDWNPDLKDFTVHALQFHALKSLYHSACIFIIKSHLNTVIYPRIYFHTYFFAYFIIMSLPFLNLFNNLLLREVVQSFRLNSNYFKRHKKTILCLQPPLLFCCPLQPTIKSYVPIILKTGSFMKQTWLFLTSKPAHMQFSLQGNSPPTSFPQLCQELFCPYQPLRTTWGMASLGKTS